MSNKTKNIKLNYLIDSTFTKGNKLFFLSLKNEDDSISFSKYYRQVLKQNTLMYKLMEKFFLELL